MTKKSTHPARPAHGGGLTLARAGGSSDRIMATTIGRIFLWAGVFAAGAMAAERPNILLILSDDMGYSDMGCYGGEIATPNLDALATRGLHFTQFYNATRCCPTRASLLTGLYPHQAGMGFMVRKVARPGYAGDLSHQAVTLAEVLRAGGYRTGMAGKWHVARSHSRQDGIESWPVQRGFDFFYGTIRGFGSFYDPDTLCRQNTFITPENDPACYDGGDQTSRAASGPRA